MALAFTTLESRLVEALVPELVNRLLPQVRVMLDERVGVLNRKLDAIITANVVLMRVVNLLQENGLIDMAKLHDDLMNLANNIDSAADRLIAKTVDSETSLADVLTRFQGISDKINQAADDNAAQGGSTGGGSGATQGEAELQPGQPGAVAAHR
jgi:hypothetical protein